MPVSHQGAKVTDSNLQEQVIKVLELDHPFNSPNLSSSDLWLGIIPPKKQNQNKNKNKQQQPQEPVLQVHA